MPSWNATLTRCLDGAMVALLGTHMYYIMVHMCTNRETKGEITMGAIDVWAQILTPRMAEQSWLGTLRRWTRQADDTRLPEASQTIAMMDAADVDMALLSAWYGPQGPLISNAEVANQISEAPDRFKGLASADLTRPMEAVRELRDLVDGDTFVGVRVVPWLWGLPPNHRLYYPIYATCVDLGVPVCTQVGHTGPLKSSETGRPIPYLEDVLLDFPDLVVVGGHVGYPWLSELISLLLKFPNLYLDTSAYALHRLPPEFAALLRGSGANRIMFGTNLPMISPADALRGLDDLGLDDKQRQRFLQGTARDVFGIGGLTV